MIAILTRDKRNMTWEVKMEENGIRQASKFKYLGSIL